MSGAFNIDIEVGPAAGKGVLKFWCASLTETWTFEQHVKELVTFRQKLLNEGDIRKHKVAVPEFDPKEMASCEAFLSRLGCTAAVLRVLAFQDFLNIPKHVREGLTYASHKPFGKTLKEGFLQKHPRFVRKNVGKRWIRLTRDERGGSLVSYSDETKHTVLASFKIGASTQLKNITESVKDAFVVKSGKRQWVLQASSTRDFDAWQVAIVEILKQFGDSSVSKLVTSSSPKEQQQVELVDVSVLGGGSSNKLDKQIAELRVQTEKLNAENEGLRQRLAELHEQKDGDGNDLDSMRRRIKAGYNKEKDNIVRDYELQHENLRSEIEDLKRQLKAETAIAAGSSGLGGLFALARGADDELTSEIDVEKKYLDAMTEEDRHAIRFKHDHYHRHDHKHIHHHQHLHIHEDTENPPVQTGDTHKVAHTITYTNTQFKIKGSFF